MSFRDMPITGWVLTLCGDTIVGVISVQQINVGRPPTRGRRPTFCQVTVQAVTVRILYKQKTGFDMKPVPAIRNGILVQIGSQRS